LSIDFLKDFENEVKNRLLALDFSYNHSLEPEENALKLINFQRRLPKKCRRSCILSNEFVCPPENSTGLVLLRSAIEEGIDLKPHLSRNMNKPSYNDPILNDWGIFHFHLGESVEDDGYIKRTKNVAFCIILDDCVNFIQVLPHGPGYSDVWVDKELIQIVHNNWNDALSAFRVALPPSDPTTQERKKFRKKNVNTTITTSDGTVYGPPGGGVMSNGASMAISSRLTIIKRDIESYQDLILNSLEEISNKLELPKDQLQLKMTFDESFGISIIENNTNKTIKLKIANQQ
jgi:hypothetical protein